MSMFCYQCQETAMNKGCTLAMGVCGKKADLANLQDLLIGSLRSLAFWIKEAEKNGFDHYNHGLFIMQSLFTTITNANFDNERFYKMIDETIAKREAIKSEVIEKTGVLPERYLEVYSWIPKDKDDYLIQASKVGILRTANEDVRSLRELINFGVKGIAAYGDHAAMLSFEDPEIYKFIVEALIAVDDDTKTSDELVAMVLKTGEYAVKVMALLDKANTSTYGHPEISKVNIGVKSNPGILISGHDLHDMEELLKQTQGTGVDVYTHSEMLPANYYPAFKKYENFVGNYGGSWWHQKEEFETFNGPILMTTNCIVPPKESYKGRMFTTGMAGYEGITHIPDRKAGETKDFSQIIEKAKKCPAPTEIETGSIVGGFAHNQVFAVADKVVELVKAGKIKRFVVMAGCDGRHKSRSYFTDVAENLPEGTIILTAGCAKYRYIKLNLGDIEGVPRVLDAGQCNDSYSLVIIALKLKEVFGLESVNDLPLSFDIAWYEQKAVAVLLALLSLGVKNIHLGPTLPAFLSPNIADFIVKTFNLQPTTDFQSDIDLMMLGK